MARLDESFEEEAGGGIPDFLRDPSGTLRRRWRFMAGS